MAKAKTATKPRRKVATQPTVISAGVGGLSGGSIIAALPPQWQWAGVVVSGIISYAVPYVVAKLQSANTQRSED